MLATSLAAGHIGGHANPMEPVRAAARPSCPLSTCQLDPETLNETPLKAPAWLRDTTGTAHTQIEVRARHCKTLNHPGFDCGRGFAGLVERNHELPVLLRHQVDREPR